jgi:glycosyltransferase involved in cell wall biosynthesis
MKILLISGSRIVGGAEHATVQLAQALLERGHRLEALCPAGGEWRAAASAARIPVYPAAIGGALNLLTPLAIGKTLSATRPDLLIVTTSDEWVWSCLMPRRAVDPRLILVRHMGLPLPFAVRWLAGRRADAIVAVSRSVRQTLLAGSAIAPSMVHVIPNAVRFPVRPSIPDSAERMRARSLLGLPETGRWIGFLGGVNLAKGIEDAMLASRRANQSLGDVRLLICGRKDPRRETPGFEELARRHGLERNVHYPGHLDDVTPAIIASDAVVIATHSTLGEGLAQTAIDAMACGTPIAAYALDGIIDAVGATESAAILARPDEVEDLGVAVTRLLQDAELAAKLAQRGLDRAREEFAPALMANRYEQLFGALLADRTALPTRDSGARD